MTDKEEWVEPEEDWPFDDELEDEDIPLEKWDDIDDVDDYKYVEERDYR